MDKVEMVKRLGELKVIAMTKGLTQEQLKEVRDISNKLNTRF